MFYLFCLVNTDNRIFTLSVTKINIKILSSLNLTERANFRKPYE